MSIKQITSHWQHYLLFVLSSIIGLGVWYNATTSYSLVGSDLIQDYSATYALLNKKSIYKDISSIALMLTGHPNHENFHPPTSALVLLPLQLLSYHKAFFAINLFSVLIYIVIIKFFFWDQFREQSEFASLLPLLIVWPPFHACIATGQISMIIIMFIVLGGVFYEKDRPILCGLSVAMAALLKLFPLYFLLFMILSKQGKMFISTLSFFLIGWLLTIWIVGIDDCSFYLSNLMFRNSAEWSPFPANQSMNGLFHTLFTNNPWTHGIVNLPVIANLCFLISVCVIATAYVKTFKLFRPMTAYWVCTIPMLLSSPITWIHIFPILLILIAQSFFNRKQHYQNNTALLISSILLSVPLMHVIRWAYQLNLHNTYFGIFVFLSKLGLVGTILLWIDIVKSCREN